MFSKDAQKTPVIPEISRGFVKWSQSGEKVIGKLLGFKPVTLENTDKAIVIYVETSEQVVKLWGNKILIKQFQELNVVKGSSLTITFIGEVISTPHNYNDFLLETPDSKDMFLNLTDISNDDLPF